MPPAGVLLTVWSLAGERGGGGGGRSTESPEGPALQGTVPAPGARQLCPSSLEAPMAGQGGRVMGRPLSWGRRMTAQMARGSPVLSAPAGVGGLGGELRPHPPSTPWGLSSQPCAGPGPVAELEPPHPQRSSKGPENLSGKGRALACPGSVWTIILPRGRQHFPPGPLLLVLA